MRYNIFFLLSLPVLLSWGLAAPEPRFDSANPDIEANAFNAAVVGYGKTVQITATCLDDASADIPASTSTITSLIDTPDATPCASDTASVLPPVLLSGNTVTPRSEPRVITMSSFNPSAVTASWTTRSAPSSPSSASVPTTPCSEASTACTEHLATPCMDTNVETETHTSLPSPKTHMNTTICTDGITEDGKFFSFCESREHVGDMEDEEEIKTISDEAHCYPCSLEKPLMESTASCGISASANGTKSYLIPGPTTSMETSLSSAVVKGGRLSGWAPLGALSILVIGVLVRNKRMGHTLGVWLLGDAEFR